MTNIETNPENPTAIVNKTRSGMRTLCFAHFDGFAFLCFGFRHSDLKILPKYEIAFLVPECCGSGGRP